MIDIELVLKCFTSMYVTKKINKQTLKFLSISLLVTALITSPSLGDKTLQLFTGLPKLEYSVQAQTLNKSDIPSKTQFEVAQALSPSEEGSSPAEQ